MLATIWRGGCIIRAKFLNRIKEAFDADPDLPTLIAAPYFRSAIESAIDSWRRVVVTATELGIPIPGFSSALSLLRRAAHRTTARRADPGQRDFFGAHTYGRIDADPAARFHTLWSGDHSEVALSVSCANRRKSPLTPGVSGTLRLLGGEAGHQGPSPCASLTVTCPLTT